MEINAFRKQFDAVLADWFLRRINEVEALCGDPSVHVILESLRSLAAGGKRLRPYLVYLGYQTNGGEEKPMLWEILAAVEAFHLFCLVHDDVMDRGASRHGVPTVHARMQEWLKEERRVGMLERVSESQAILAGDLLFSRVSQTIAKIPEAFPKTGSRVQEIMYRMVNEVVVGQILDVDLTTRARVGVREIEEKMRLKTASYSFVRPLMVGGMLAGASEKYWEFAEKFGNAVGVAFQLQDDLLDIIGDEEKTGKPIMRDLEERQQTFFTSYIFERGKKEEVDLLESAWGKSDAEQQKKVQELYIASGAVEEGRNRVRTLLDVAKQATESIDPNHAPKFTTLVEKLESRKT